MRLYCVLWMPTVIHQEFNNISEGKVSEVFEISDSVTKLKENDEIIYCRLSLAPNNDIKVEIYKDRCACKRIETLCFTLVYQDHSHNGLFKYSIDIDDEVGNPLLLRGEKLFFPCDIYNKIKEFYHKHNFHKVDDGDSMIKPLLVRYDVEIHQKDNDALKYYLHQYENKFRNALKYIEIQYDSLIERQWFRNFSLLMFGRGKHHSFYKLATRMKGDKAYYNSLLYSCYNTISELKPISDDEENAEEVKKTRRNIFNVVNSIECLNVMEERVNNRFNIQTSVISFWVAIFAILLSVLFYFLSINHSDSSNTVLMLLLDIWSKIG